MASWGGAVSRRAARIAGVDACEVLDSRGRPTVFCEVTLADGTRGAASVPSGASTGGHERYELRDGGERYDGRGVRRAVANVVDVLAPVVTGLRAADQEEVDAALLGAESTPALSRLGANAVLSVSIATALAAARSLGCPLYRHLAEALDVEPLLPLPMVNVLSGGAHAGGCLDVQDFLVVPVAAESFAEAIEWCARVREATGRLASRGGHQSALVADEGGLGLALSSNQAALELLLAGIEDAGLKPGEEMAIAIDVAATQLATGSGYRLRTEQRSLSAAEWVAELDLWRQQFPIVSIEDPLAEDDWDGWRASTSTFGDELQLLGDDLFATDVERLDMAIARGVANAVLVKVNQIGTLSGARTFVERARSTGYATVISARSGETEDCWLADLAVGWAAGQIKVGSTTRSERTAKWNRLLRIEHALGCSARFAGRAAIARSSRSG